VHDKSTTTYKTDDVTYADGVLVDITLRKQAEEKLSQSETRYRDLVDHSLVGVFNTNLDGQFLFVNEALVRMYDFDRPEQMMAEGSLSRWVDPKRRELLMSDLQEHGSVSNFEAETITATGRHIHVLFSVKLQDGELAGMVMDVTERTHGVDRIHAYQKRLRAMASELVFAEERERKRISTDLHDGPAQSLAYARLQLASVLKNIEVAPAKRKLEDLSQLLKDSLQQIRDVLLDLSSPSLHQIGLGAALSEWLEEQVESHHGIRATLTNTCPNLELYDNLKAVLFRNIKELLSNMIKHAEARQVSVKMYCEKGNLYISVKDDGIGFDPDQLAHHPGSTGGFGLFSIRERMADLDGSMEINSALGQGCMATLSLPLSCLEEGKCL
jgi:PAS domain S-box-containing protein